ncbi:MAG: radical SAM protein [Bacteroidetes bacterium]|nr:MAG: radical SAM protein [Bacteroidota bacterium]
MRYYNIPIFIPELACPFQCIYCDQRKITGQSHFVNEAEIISTIDDYLETISREDCFIQLAFFGGTFTGLSIENQKQYLELVQPYIVSKQIQGIRISTRPDYITNDILRVLKQYNVTNIELGAQSLIDEVLEKVHRGHTFNDVKIASEMIINYGFTLGLQMMLGLPGDTKEYSLETAKRIIELGAKETRIYPTLVIKGTALDTLLKKGKYSAMTTLEAVEQSVELFQLFNNNNVKVIRIGLYPSENLLNEELVAGPDMRHFKEKVMSQIWNKKLKSIIHNSKDNKQALIFTAKNQLNFANGFKAANKVMLLNHFRKVKFKVDSSLKDFEYHVDYSR